MSNKTFTTFAWVSSLEGLSGESVLARTFLLEFTRICKRKILIRTDKNSYFIDIKNFKKKLKNLEKRKNKISVIHNYLSPIKGIVYSWYYFFKGKKILYINYLPLWNSLIFLLLPPKTRFGPVTGGVYQNKVNTFSLFIRKYIMPALYKINLFFLLCRVNKVLFSTDYLKQYISKKKIRECYFNFNLKNFYKSSQQNKNRDIDFLIYYNKSRIVKMGNFQLDMLERLIDLKKYNIYAIGDVVILNKVKNLGYISRKKLFKYLSRTKYTINQADNFYSIFALDCLSAGVKIFFNKDLTPSEQFFSKDYFFSLNYNNSDLSFKKIINILNNKKYKAKKLDYKIFNKINKRFDNYFFKIF